MADQDFAVYVNIDKWLKATAGMDEDTRSWYFDLLLHQYDKDGLESDLETLAGYARVRMTKYEKFKQVFEQVFKHKFEQCSDGKLRNPYMNEILLERKTFKENRARAGQISYVLKIFRSQHRANKEAEKILKEIFNPEMDIKDQTQVEHLFKQVFEQLRDRDRSSNSNKGLGKKGEGEGRGKRTPKDFIPPELNEVEIFFQAEGFPRELAEHVWKYYSDLSANGKWYDGQGNEIRSWKSKMRAVWMKPENKNWNGKATTRMDKAAGSKGRDAYTGTTGGAGAGGLGSFGK